jgi:hypothetical protein
MTRTASLALFALLGTLFVTGTTAAKGKQKEAYEHDLIAGSLARVDLVPDPHPEEKIIEKVLILRHPIVEKSDPWPDFANNFHVTTREHIVRQELLFEAGQTYNEELVRESARNLRGLPLLFSTVRIVTAKGSRPDRLVVVVITKDLWSIRINSNFNVGGGVFQFISCMPTEQNFLGYNQQISLYNRIDRDVYTLGEIYRVPRLFGSRLALSEFLALRVNHESGEVEGGFGQVIIERPLFSLSTQWGYSLSAAFDIGIDRIYQGADLHYVKIPADQPFYLLPETYRHSTLSTQAVIRRSFGKAYKTDLTAGYRIHSRTYGLTDGFLPLPDWVKQDFKNAVVPLDDRAGSLIAAAHFYQATYHRCMNIQTLGLTEDLRLGPEAIGEASWANPAFGFAQNSVKLRLALGWRFLFYKNILWIKTDVSARYRPDHELIAADTDWVDQSAEFYLENIAPLPYGLGRAFFRFRYVYTQYTQDRSKLFLGGNNTLRGFIPGFTAGPRLLNFNVEYRSPPWVFKTLHLGLVVFYDAGDTYGFTQESDFTYHQSLGIGIRGLFPQFDRGVMRLDIGIPLGRDYHTRVIDWVTIAFLQAF